MRRNSTPRSGAFAPAPTATTLSGTKVKLNFGAKSPSTDTLTFGGVLPVPANFKFTGQTFSFDFGGVMRALPLFNSGRSAAGDNTIVFAKPKNGAAAFKVSIENTILSGTLASAGLTTGSFAAKPVTIPVKLLFNGAIYSQTLKLTYKAVQGTSGMAQ